MTAYSSMAQMSLIVLGLFSLTELGINGRNRPVGRARARLGDALPARRDGRDAHRHELLRRARRDGARPAGARDGADDDRDHRARGARVDRRSPGEFLILAGVYDVGWGWAAVGAGAIVLAAMYMLRLISAVLHEARGDRRRATSRPTCAGSSWRSSSRSWPRCSSSPPGRPRSRTARSRRSTRPRPPSDRDPEGRLARARADAGAARRVRRRAARQRARAVVDAPRLHRRSSRSPASSPRASSPRSSSSESAEGRTLIAESFTRDRLGALAAIIVAGAGALTVLVSWGENRRDHAGEYYALLAAAGAGMAFFVTAGNLMTLFLGLEWFSIALYILCALDTHRETSLEAGLKYLIVGSFGSAILLFGSALVYGATGELGFSADRRGRRRRQRAAARRPGDADRRASASRPRRRRSTCGRRTSTRARRRP